MFSAEVHCKYAATATRKHEARILKVDLLVYKAQYTLDVRRSHPKAAEQKKLI